MSNADLWLELCFVAKEVEAEELCFEAVLCVIDGMTPMQNGPCPTPDIISVLFFIS